MVVLLAILDNVTYDVRCNLAKLLRRMARRLDSYPLEFMGPIHGENGEKPLGRRPIVGRHR